MKIQIIQDIEGYIEQGFYCVFNISENKKELLAIFQFKKEAKSYVSEIKKHNINKVNPTNYNGIILQQ